MTFETPPLTRDTEEQRPDGTKEDSREQCIHEESFLAQLHEERTLVYHTEGGKSFPCVYTEIIPETIRNERPVIFVGGFGTGAITYTEQLCALARHGRRVVYCNPLKGIPVSPDLLAYAESCGLPELLAEKAQEVLFLKERLCFGKADIVGHSQGGAVGTLVTAFAPDEVAELVLDTPAGLVGEATRKEFILRALTEMQQEKQFAQDKEKQGDPAYMRSFARNATRRAILEHFLWRMTTEIPMIGKIDIVPLLHRIRAASGADRARPYVALVTANNDALFPPEEVESHLATSSTQKSVDALLDSWVMYVDPTTGHGAFAHHDPEVVRTMLLEGETSGGRTAVILDLLKQGEGPEATY